MPHYKDGTPAKVGDVVKGKGYNVKHEIVGILVKLTPGPTCNVTIAYVGIGSQLRAHCDRDGKPYEGQPLRATAEFEYGQADAFEKIA